MFMKLRKTCIVADCAQMGGSIVRGCFTSSTLSLTRLTTRSHHAHGFASSPQSPSSALNPSHPVFRSFFTSVESKRLGKHIRVRGTRSSQCAHKSSAVHGVNPGSSFLGSCRGRSNFRGSVSFSSVGLSSVNVIRPRRERVVRCSSSAAADPPISAMQTSPKVTGPRVSFCPACGGVMEQRIPEGEHELRAICSKCGCIHYQNPKMVVGCLVEHENKVLLCRRNIEPSYGLWTLPAGYMELGESAAEGAARETMEEARADVEVVGHFAHLDIPLIGQSYIIFRARLKQPTFSPGPESLECALFALDEIPFDSIAFSSISVALKMYIEDVKGSRFRQHHGVIDKRPGASPSDPHGYIVRDHLIV